MRYSVFFLTFLASCSTFQNKPASSTPLNPISLSFVESLNMGKSAAQILEQTIGKPDQVFPNKWNRKSDETIWIYNRTLPGGNPVQRASFIVDNRGILIAATWLPNPGDSINNQVSILDHFKSYPFNTQEEGWISKDAYSNDLIYNDQKHGISFVIHKATHEVSVISFGVPKTNPLAKDL